MTLCLVKSAPTEQTDAVTEARERIASLMLRPLPSIPPVARCYGAERSKAIRDLFRLLGWSKILRVTKGGWTVGAQIEWQKDVWPESCGHRFGCTHMREWTKQAETEHPHAYFQSPICGCDEYQRAQRQVDAIRKRMHYALSLLFADDPRFGDRSDTQSDYFDSDYTFFPSAR